MLIQWFIQGQMYKTDLKSAIVNNQINKKACFCTQCFLAFTVFLQWLFRFEGPFLVLSDMNVSLRPKRLCVSFSLVQLGFCYLWCLSSAFTPAGDSPAFGLIEWKLSVCVRLILRVFSQMMLSYTSDYEGASLHSWWQRLPAQNSQSPTCQITHSLAEQIFSDLYSYQMMMMMMVIILKALRYWGSQRAVPQNQSQTTKL